jgi:hypothetical protein
MGQAFFLLPEHLSLTGVYFTTHSRLVFTTRDRPVFTRRLPDGESVALFLQQILLSGGERLL